MSRWIDRLLSMCASLRLAIAVIVLLASYLAIGTLYESRYGTRAARLMIYQSPAFYAVLALLALNVMAAAVVRIPWKRHQTGFVITHIGIEVLLLGCLFGASWGVDGRMILRPGDRAAAVQLDGEHLAIAAAGSTDDVRIISLEQVKSTAYPSSLCFALEALWHGAREVKLDRAIKTDGGPRAVAIAQWHPAVRVTTEYAPIEHGAAAAQVRVFGTTPDGAKIDQTTWFAPGAAAELFGGEIRFRFASDPPAFPRPRGELALAREADGAWRATLFGGPAVRASSTVKIGEARPAWMGLSVSIEQILESAEQRQTVTPVRVSADRIDSATAALKVSIGEGDARHETWLLRGDRPKRLETAAGAVDVSYGFNAAELPFEIELLEAAAPTDRSLPSAKVAVHHNGRREEHAIALNQPATVAGRSIYLTAVESAGGPVAFVSVRRDPGWPVKYAGAGLIVAGTAMMFLIRKPRSIAESIDADSEREPVMRSAAMDLAQHARPARSFATLRITMPFVLIAMLVTSARADVNLDPARTIPIQHNGRVKPLDTVARQTVRFIRGRETDDSLRTMLNWSAYPASAETSAIIAVPRIELRLKLGFDDSEKLVSPARLRGNTEGMKWIGELAERKRVAGERGEVVSFTPLESAALEVRERLAAFDQVIDRSIYRISTVSSPAAAHVTVDELLSAATNDSSKVAELSARVSSGLSERERSSITHEVMFNCVHPFRWVGLLYAAVLVVLMIRSMNRAGARYRLGWPGVALGLAIAGHAVAFSWRCAITGWAPVTNMYETIVWVGGVAAGIGLILSITSCATIAAVAGTLIAVLACIIGDIIPPDLGRSIETLTPVLQSNLWLTVHVLTVVSSYAAFAVGLVLANVALWKFSRRRFEVGGLRFDEEMAASSSSSIQPSTSSLELPQNLQPPQNLARLIYRAIQIGVVLIAAGTVLGAMWADVSWGRFWGWDPKEVWALIVLLSYLALLHGKVAGWVGDFGLAVGAVVCFLAVLMSWYGVNFVLGVGLHSYGFGAGGIEYVLGYVAAQLGFVIWASWRYRSGKTQMTKSEIRVNDDVRMTKVIKSTR